MNSQWANLWTVAVGGLTDVGFSADESFVLVLGHAGRGLLDSQTGERVARDSLDDWSFLDQGTGLAQGIGPVADHSVRVGGLMSGQVLLDEVGGWRVYLTDTGVAADNGRGAQQVIEEAGEVRAFGFSDSGRLLLIASPSDLALFALEPGP